MPLSKLFHKRNSLKGEKAPEVFPGTKDSVSEVFSDNKCDEDMQSNEQHQQKVENKTVLEEMVNEKTNANREDSDVPLICKDNPQDEMKRKEAKEETGAAELLKNKNRSLSCRECGPKSSVSRFGRRKCESESGLSNSTDDEGFEDKVIQLREKDLEKVIGHFVDKLIRESIATAVRSVNVDSVYDEVMRSVSRSQSESSDSTGCLETVQQKLHTDSVTEYEDLRRVRTFEEDKMPEVADDKVSENSESFQSINIGTEFSTASSYPGNAQLQTDDESEDEETTVQNEGTETVSKEERVAPPTADGLQDTSTQKTSTPMKLAESVDRTNINGSSQLEVSCLLTTDLVENEATQKLQVKVKSSEVSESTPQIKGIKETKDTENISDDKPMNVREHIAQEEIEVGMDEYHADCEESISIHSLASESSEKQAHNCPPASVERGSKELCGEVPKSLGVEADLMALSGDDFSQLLKPSEAAVDDESSDLGENLPEPKQATEEEMKVNWKVGYLHVKLPHKARGKGHLKVWKKRCVAIQPDEFANDPSNPCLVLSVYSGESGAARKHSASFWKSVSCHKAVVCRSSSRTHKYAFTISDDQGAVVHLSAESEALAQEWMTAIRAILWPPSPVVQLEKMLNGCQFEISIIDNDFSFRAGLLGAYGHLTITPRKLILVHPQQGYVVQEWYLNTVDKFQLVPQTRIEDVNKVLAMTTCSDSSTGRGDILIFCREAVGLLQAVASTIHSILTQHSTEEGGTYQKELEEIGQWLDLPQPQEDYYKVPPRQVKSLLDIPNFIFDKPVISASTVTSAPESSMDTPAPSEDFLNCSVTSFVVGGGTGKSSDSELSDTYSPPRSPEMKAKKPT
ncbi:PH domain-containing protein [Trichonephila clavata]|uniref:PH domain-containing protein n=1 Tax=Trichonephila clavata TaxID=2740835 RepID=A0A8X6I0S8_TRICU|nr:PH domain-containing protein [Trichonephila clavata]